MDDQALEHEYDQLSSYPEAADYYSLLALPRDPTPTDAQIRSAYRSLTLSFHPDKQPPHLQDAARRQFDRIQTAYETLIDPKKRFVYDMLGEEGVKAEWAIEGTMGRGGAAEQQQVGVQSMDADQFRRWFLMRMKNKERSALVEMVESHSLIQCKVDATSMFHKEFDDSISLHTPSPKIASFALGANFKTPFSPLEWFHAPKVDHDDSEEDEEDKNIRHVDDSPESDGYTPLRIHTMVNGKFQPTKGLVTYVNQETGEEEEEEVELPSHFMAHNVSLGATLHHSIEDRIANGNRLNNLLFPYLGDSELEVGAQLLPSPALSTTFSKSVTPVKDTGPFHFALSTATSESPLKSPPILNLSVARRLGLRNQIYCNWSSGTLSWPPAIERLLSPLRSETTKDETHLIFPGKSSSLELGFMVLPTKRVSPGEDEGDGEFDDNVRDTSARAPINGPLESWGFLLQSSPSSMQLSINYGRNLFTTGAQRPAVSEWSYEGYHPRKTVSNKRPVRLEINTTVDLDLSFGWTVTGTRQVSEFTRMGFGIGLQGAKGLICSITWSRLGQVVKVPIIICPFELVDADIASLAVALPWLTYSAVEFGILRPRERRKQQKAVARQRKRLKKLVAQRKAEGLQAIELMGDQVKRRQAREEEKDGLVILHAVYGYFPQDRSSKDVKGDDDTGEKVVDVTIPVAALVEQGQLILPKRIPKSEILGFSDPAPLMPKTLKVKYRFAGNDHAAEIGEFEGITFPMKSHRLGNVNDHDL